MLFSLANVRVVAHQAEVVDYRLCYFEHLILLLITLECLLSFLRRVAFLLASFLRKVRSELGAVDFRLMQMCNEGPLFIIISHGFHLASLHYIFPIVWFLGRIPLSSILYHW